MMGAESARRMRETIRVARIAARGLLMSRLPQMAAALAYRTIFGLAPVTVISLAVLGAFATEEQITLVVERALEYTGLQGVEIPEANLEASDPPGDEADPQPSEGEPGAATAGPPADSPDSPGDAPPERLDEWVRGLVDNVSGLKFGAIGAVGVALLIYAALGMVVEVERAFNNIYRAPRGRAWSQRLTQYWTTLTLGALLLVATFYVGGRTKSWLTGLVATDQLTIFQSLWVGSVGFGVTVAISTIMLLLVYTTVPNARVHVRSALAGAFVAAILWEAGKWGFTQYLSYSTRLTQVYGSLAILPLFLLWIYVTWLVVLFGLQVSYGVQHIGLINETEDDEADGPVFVEPAALVVLAAHLAAAFREGHVVTTAVAADGLCLSEADTQRLLERLEAAGVARRADAPDRGWTLARPADAIPLVEIFDAGVRAIRAADDRPEDACDPWRAHITASLRDAQRAHLAGRPLATLLPDPEPMREPEAPNPPNPPEPPAA